MRRKSGPRRVASRRTARSLLAASAGSHLEDSLAWQIRAAGLPEPVRQAQLIPDRKFLWDFAWPAARLAVEVQGGIWRTGGHTTGAGVTRDCEKAALILIAGWRPLSVTADHVRTGRALSWIETLLRDVGAHCGP